MSGESVEIDCPACGCESLLVRKPLYDGFTPVGERLSCASCGHEFTGEEDVPFKKKADVAVFTEADRSAHVELFEENEAGRICRHCSSYVINPFMQWCDRHKREVEATDTCGDFTPADDQE